ncbi:CDF family Co(II)/Ni(II) efflux transporter DmeF [Methylovulum miyakonense]|uniref:CDF family Co(II)/Ni(II) efflux transporter DmeF n=1 Tax=Methylovulum miyakonense TaxID=645578 RepID=UPI00037474DE|nr:CDF family Co(II)/Ni(II) efflux transporter DmeF [Methylovulum miyakonense]
MHSRKLKDLQHHHDFAVINKKGERRTWQVLVLTFLMMVLEIAAGTVFGSMALLADGWHMATHVAAFVITLFAYRYSRLHADDHTFAFSPGKVGVLGGFASSIALGVVAIMMLVESGERILHPREIHFDEAIIVAGVGLLVNVLCALLLKDHHGHDHAHHHDPHEHHHQDHNLKAAYAHVLADALTSVLAIIALATGKYYGLNWLDPAMGIVGALIIARWSHSLVRETSPVLTDESLDLHYKTTIQQAIEQDADNRVADLHIWCVGPGHFAVIISLVSHHPQSPDYYKALLKPFYRLQGLGKLSHITVEVNQCMGGDGC